MLKLPKELQGQALPNYHSKEFKVPKQIRVYVNKKGKERVSTTSVLQVLPDAGWLKQWKARVGENKAGQIMSEAALRGTICHGYAENFFSGSSIPVPRDDKIERMIGGIDKWIAEEFLGKYEMIKEDWFDNPNGVMAETQWFNSKFGVAGQADFGAVKLSNGVKMLGDYKTSSQSMIQGDTLHKYKMQNACYIMLANEELRNKGRDDYFREGWIVVFCHAVKSGLGHPIFIEREEVVPLFKEYLFYKKVFDWIYKHFKNDIKKSYKYEN